MRYEGTGQRWRRVTVIPLWFREQGSRTCLCFHIMDRVDWVPQPRGRGSLFDKHALISLGLRGVQTQTGETLALAGLVAVGTGYRLARGRALGWVIVWSLSGRLL